MRDRGKRRSERAERIADAIAKTFQNEPATKGDSGVLQIDRKACDHAIHLAELKLETRIEASKVEILTSMVLGAMGLRTLVIISTLVWVIKA